MDPSSIFCPNPDCPACGQRGQGNIGVHSCKERRYICHVCKKTFAETKGTAFYRLHHAKDLFVLVITLLAYGRSASSAEPLSPPGHCGGLWAG